MSSASSAFSSLLATVEGIANSVTSVANTTTKSIGMLDAFVTKAANEQRYAHVKDELNYEEDLLADYSRKRAEQDLKVVAFCSQSPVHKELYEKHYNKLAGALQKLKPQTATTED